MTYGELVLRYRNDHGLTQRAFAQKCKLSNAYIAMLEQNYNPTTGKPIEPNVKTLKAIANGLDMSFNDLLAAVDGDSPIVINSDDDRHPESRILDMYDRLSPDNRIRLEAYLAGLLDTQQRP